MKNLILKSLLVGSLLSSSAFGYEASSVKVNVMAYKTKAKSGVAITFDKVSLSIKKNTDFSKFITSAEVSIDVNSINSKMKFRDNNIKATLFKIANISEVKAKVLKVTGNDKTGTLDVEVSMNNVKKIIPMKYTVSSGTLKADGVLDILDFAMSKSYAAFAAKCKGFHGGKSFSDVALSFSLSFTK